MYQEVGSTYLKRRTWYKECEENPKHSQDENYHFLHNQWTIHTPAECKRLKSTRGKQDYKNKKAIKRQDFKDKKQAFIQAKAAY
jgi:hypothetical protein